jgi:signal transduction histidine kinase
VLVPVRLRARFFLAFVGLTAILALLGGLLGVWLIHRAAVREANASLTLSLQAVLSVFDTLQHEWSLLVGTLGGGRRVAQACADPASPATIGELEAIRRQVGFDIFLLTDREGRVATRTTPPYHTGDMLRDDPVRAALNGTTRAGFVVLHRDRLLAEGDDVARRAAAVSSGDALALIVAAPAFDRDGRQAGTLVAGVVLNGSPLLQTRLRSLIIAGEEAPPAVVASVYLNGARVLTTGPCAAGLDDAPSPNATGVGTRAPPERSRGCGDEETPAGTYLVATAGLGDPAGGPPASLSVGIPSARFAALRRSMGVLYGGVGLAGVLVAVLISLRLAGRLARPIDRLARAAGEVASGRFDVRLEEPRARDEVRALTAAFNQMAEALRQRDARLAAARQDLEAANERLAALNESYLNMLGFVSHELKNVLGTINWSVQALEGGLVGTLSDPQSRLIGTLRRAVDGALAMTRNFLDLARIETGGLKLDLQRCDLGTDVVHPVLQELGAEAVHRAMRIESDVPDGLQVTGDANLLRVVVRNLLGNALRYGRRDGHVRISGGTNGETVRLDVWNEGEGLGREQIAQLFGKFRRFATGRKDAPRGSGLGLFIVREILSRHGGTIAAESQPGMWMRFLVTLPVSGPATGATNGDPSPEPTEAPQPAASRAGARPAS